MVDRRVKTGLRLLTLSLALGSLAACGTTTATKTSSKRSKEYFAESKYGVKASPRVVFHGPVPKGGGRDMVGKPYVVKGQVYYPKEDRSYDRVGFASWYGSAFHGRYTANGEIYDTSALTAAHPTFPLPSYARVTNTTNGASIIVRVNDRGPYERGRIIDLSSKTAEMLDMKGHGTAKVRVQYVGRARMDGQDQAFLMASYVPKGSRIPSQIAPGVMVASNDTRLPASALPVRMPAPVAAAAPMVAPTPKRAPTLALSEPVNEPIPFQVQSPAFVILPEVGPVPRIRPGSMQLASSHERSLASGYAETEDRSGANAPFRALVAETYELNADKIRASYVSDNGG
ncbi:septal ring lytic transglycosylase RlpA family protein [Rhizobium sp. C4]|uniref:septal ring lytic transglycosylase RlpA family protein n=1 Tax=Rhizobium sp. C4 TaxID=1349800 RepID=UPI001E352247|nr:septal ring lytic transglycosylase RlpA family protein [Rhizobium sp. C4]MCD2171418.1 septal ring lytic transglycosylase RlpA family protein [Rhizobium sp. C4]